MSEQVPEGPHERTVMFRDASYLRSPGCATRYHLPRDGSDVAACDSSILLNPHNACTVSEAGPLFCRRCERLAGHNT